MFSTHSCPIQPFAAGKVDSTPRSRLGLNGLKVILFLIIMTGLGWTSYFWPWEVRACLLRDLGEVSSFLRENLKKLSSLVCLRTLFFQAVMPGVTWNCLLPIWKKSGTEDYRAERRTKIRVLDTNFQLLNHSIWRAPSASGLQASWVNNLSYWSN